MVATAKFRCASTLFDHCADFLHLREATNRYAELTASRNEKRPAFADLRFDRNFSETDVRNGRVSRWENFASFAEITSFNYRWVPCYNNFMAIIFNNTEEKSELQRKITAELREKQAAKAKIPQKNGGATAPEFDVEKSEYLKDMETSRVPGWVWGFLFLAIGMVIFAVLR